MFVEGKLRTRKWQDKQGNDRYTTEIIADNMQMLGGRGGAVGGGRGRRRRARRRQPVRRRGTTTTSRRRRPAPKRISTTIFRSDRAGIERRKASIVADLPARESPLGEAELGQIPNAPRI